MEVRGRRAGPRVRGSAWWTVLAMVLASLGIGAAPAAAADPWVPAGPTVAFSVTAPGSVVAGVPFALTVTARDAAGAVATSYRGTVAVTSDDRRAPVLPAAYTFTDADQGVHTFTGVALHRAGSRTVTVVDMSDHWLTGAASVLVKAGPLAALTVSGPSRAVAGVPFDVRVSAVDAWANWVPAYRGTVTFRSTDGKVRSLPPRYTFTAADRGSHVFTGLVTLVSTGRFLVVGADVARPAVAGRLPVLVAGAGASLQGQVLSGFDPISGATVTVYDAVTSKRLATVTLGRTASDYLILGLPAGGIKVGGTHPERCDDFANNVDTLAAATVFTLRPGTRLVQSFDEPFGPYIDLGEPGIDPRCPPR
jgi:hypothetical protein